MLFSVGDGHMWMPLLNHYRSFRQISTVGEIDCPNQKRFNSLLTRNQFIILERILSDNWCLGATFSNWPQVSLMLKRSFFWIPINQTQIFNCGRKRPGRPQKKISSYWKFIEVTHSRKSGSGCGSGVIIILLKLFFFKFPDLVHGPTAAPVGAGSQLSFFLPGSSKTPHDMSKWGLKTILFISNMHAGFFLYRAGLVITRWML